MYSDGPTVSARYAADDTALLPALREFLLATGVVFTSEITSQEVLRGGVAPDQYLRLEARGALVVQEVDFTTEDLARVAGDDVHVSYAVTRKSTFPDFPVWARITMSTPPTDVAEFLNTAARVSDFVQQQCPLFAMSIGQF